MTSSYKGGPIDYRSSATRAAWPELSELYKQIEANEQRCEDIECGAEYVDCAEDVLDELRAERRRLNKELDSRIIKCEADDLSKIAKNLLDALGGAAELRLSIYEFLCVENDGVHIPDLNHEFFHEHDTGDTVSMVACEEISWPRRLDQDEKKEIVNRRLTALKERFMFNPNLLNPQLAREITEAFFKVNVVHFRDARLMNELINTPFPCGSIPKDHVRNIVIYIRFEDFLERAGWNVRTCCYDTPHEPGPEFKWIEHGVYNRFRRDIAFIQRLVFARPPEVTLLLVTPFCRWDAEDLDKDRINLNFLEVVLPTYNHLKKNGSATKVISKRLSSLSEAEYAWGAGWVPDEDEDITWQVEIAAKTYAQSTAEHYAYPGGRKSSKRERLENRIKETAAKRAG